MSPNNVNITIVVSCKSQERQRESNTIKNTPNRAGYGGSMLLNFLLNDATTQDTYNATTAILCHLCGLGGHSGFDG